MVKRSTVISNLENLEGNQPREFVENENRFEIVSLIFVHENSTLKNLLQICIERF